MVRVWVGGKGVGGEGECGWCTRVRVGGEGCVVWLSAETN